MITGVWVVPDDRTPAVRWDPSALRLELKSGKEKMSLYEPLVVVYTLRNLSDSNVGVPADLEYGMGEVTVSIQADSGSAVPYADDIVARSLVHAMPRVLGPHQADAHAVSMFFNGTSNDLAFVRQGRYTLGAALHVGNAPDPVFVRASTIGVEVREPTARDRNALEVLGGVERFAKMIRFGVEGYCKGDGETACLDRIQALRTRFGDSVYAPWVTIRYGEALARGNIKSEEESAVDVFDDFVRRWPGHSLEANVVADMVIELGKIGRRDEALEWLHRFEKNFPERVSQVRDLRARVE
jgi:hypothetical protein